MSDAGLQVFNDDNILVIDGTFANLALIAKGVAVTDTALVSASTKTFTVSGVIGRPLLVVSGAMGADGVAVSMSGTTATLTIIAAGSAGKSVSWWLFADPVAAGQYLVVFNAAGKMVFNAAEKYMRYAGSVAVSPGTTPASLTLPAGRTYATYMVTPASRGIPNTTTPGSPDAQWYLDTTRSVAKVAGNVVTSVEVQTARTGPYTGSGVPSAYAFGTAAFVVDVTAY